MLLSPLFIRLPPKEALDTSAKPLHDLKSRHSAHPGRASTQNSAEVAGTYGGTSVPVTGKPLIALPGRVPEVFAVALTVAVARQVHREVV